MLKRLFLASIVVMSVACSSPEPKGPIAVKDLPNIDTNLALADIKKLSSDEFEGRAPGSKGEELTAQYLIDQFKAAGLQPGNPDGTWIQKVPLVSLTPTNATPLTVTGKGKSRSVKIRDEFVPFSRQVADTISLSKSELVFVGYGVQAPEFNWDDYKGLDVKGKTIVVLVNDPQVTVAGGTALDPATFRGDAMTYYGRWTYKYDKGAELGADAVIIVHETRPAGYGFNVVQGFGGERFDLVTPNKNMDKTKVQSWIGLDAAKELFKMAGLDYDGEKAKAATREFKPVPMGLSASIKFTQTMRTVDSKNIIAKLPGSDPVLANENVVFSAHWDGYGIGVPAANGDKIYNGAADNASGTAGIIAIARAAMQTNPKPKRTMLFLAVTAEEQGLLGSLYYAKFPLYPLNKTVANINVDDNLSMYGKTSDTIVIGLGASDLDDYIREAAAELGKTLKPDAEPEKGFYYRSDHFNFAKVGVPALNTDDGIDVIGKPAGFGKEKKEYYTRVDYHQASDDVKADWDMSGYGDDAKLLFAVGYRVAQADKMPEWKPGNEFKAIRDASLKK